MIYAKIILCSRHILEKPDDFRGKIPTMETADNIPQQSFATLQLCDPVFQ